MICSADARLANSGHGYSGNEVKYVVMWTSAGGELVSSPNPTSTLQEERGVW